VKIVLALMVPLYPMYKLDIFSLVEAISASFLVDVAPDSVR